MIIKCLEKFSLLGFLPYLKVRNLKGFDWLTKVGVEISAVEILSS